MTKTKLAFFLSIVCLLLHNLVAADGVILDKNSTLNIEQEYSAQFFSSWDVSKKQILSLDTEKKRQNNAPDHVQMIQVAKRVAQVAQKERVLKNTQTMFNSRRLLQLTLIIAIHQQQKPGRQR